MRSPATARRSGWVIALPAVTIALFGLAGCKPFPDAFRCTSPAQCIVSGESGTCEPSGFCSRTDPTCPSGRRFLSAGPLDGQCVAVDGSARGGDLGADDLGAPDLGASLCPGFTGLLCEGFEGASLSSALNVYLPNASYERDPSRSVRGNASGLFHLGAAGPQQRTYGELGDLSTPTSGTVAARAFFYFPSAPPYVGSRLIEFRQNSGSFLHIFLGFTQGKLQLHSSITGTYRGSTVDLPLGRWLCLELVVTYGASGSARSYLDGQEVTSLRIDENTLTSPPINGNYFGIAVDSTGTNTPAYDYWVDEIAIDTTPIGCNR